MIVVDDDKCTGCGLCVKICHEHCVSFIEDAVSITHELCSTCTQCIAVCPTLAISWDGIPPVAYDESRLPSPGQLDELLKERRTLRFFKEKRLNHGLLAEIVGYGIYSPTNNYALRAIVVDDKKVIDEFDRIIMRFILPIYTIFFKQKVVFNLIRRITPAIDWKDAVKMERALERGQVLHNPAAVVLIVGDRRIALSEESAQYASYNMILYAQVKGVGSCLWGNAKVFLDRSKTARKRLKMQKHEHILGGLLLGYPAVRFSNKVEGRSLGIEWIRS